MEFSILAQRSVEDTNDNNLKITSVIAYFLSLQNHFHQTIQSAEERIVWGAQCN